MRGWLVLALLADAAAFKFLANFKAASLIPRPSAMLKRRKAAQKFGDKKLAVITGASSGLGLATTAQLLQTGEYHVFGAVRDLEKMRAVAEDQGFAESDFTPLQVELGSFDSVREFCKNLDKAKLNRPIDRLICNAATYVASETPVWTVDNHEQTLQVNYLSHFLMISLLLPGLEKAINPRVIMVGGARAEDGVVTYPRADLSSLEGLKAGAKNPISMLDGFNFEGAKAYKDSKLCISMLSNMLHKRYHRQTGIMFSAAYPGEISDSALQAGKPPLEKAAVLPGFVKAIADFELSALKTLGLGDDLHADGLSYEVSRVSTAEAARRVFQVAHDGRCSKSGSYWSWKEGVAAAEAADAASDADDSEVGDLTRVGWEAIYENEPSDKVVDFELSQELWKHTSLVTDASWPPAYQARSPCPTLVVVGAVTKAMNAKEEAKRTLHGSLNAGGETASSGHGSSLGGKVLGGTGVVIDAIAGNTVGRVAKLAQDKLLGDVPVEAVQGSTPEISEISLDTTPHPQDDETGLHETGRLQEQIEIVLREKEMQARS